MIGLVFGIALWLAIGGHFKPSAYNDDWYGWVLNQFAHIGITLLPLTVTVCVAALLWEIPTQWQLAVNSAGLCIGFQFMQWHRAGGDLSDKVQDALFMAYGSVPLCYLFKVGADDLPKMVSVGWMLAYLTVVSAHFAYGAGVRGFLKKEK